MINEFQNTYNRVKENLSKKKWESEIDFIKYKAERCFDEKIKNYPNYAGDLSKKGLIEFMKEKVKECTSEISYSDYYDACNDVYYPARKFYENLNIEYNTTNINVYEGKVNIAGGLWKGFKNLFRRKKNINKEEFENNMRSIKNEILNDLDKTKKNINDKMSKLDKEISFDNEQVQNILKIEKNKISTESW